MRRLVPALAFAVSAALASPALADGLIVVPPHPRESPHLRNVPLWVRSHQVTVEVKGRVAVTDVDQVFVNPNPRALEGTYVFPLPKGAAIDRFSMWIDGKEMTAELLDATKAREIYEGIVREMRDPALLEYAEQGLFKARIFPIDANGEKRVRIRYAEVLPSNEGTVAYRYPLATERFSSRPLERCSIAVSIEDEGGVASVWSPSHRIDAPATAGKTAKVGWEERNTLPARDFLLFWRRAAKAVGVAALAHRDAAADAEGTFLLVVAPRPDAADAPMPKDVVFVIDTSGSMAGPKMEQARGALRFCLRSLGAEDRFAIVPFSTEPRPFRDALVPATAENRAAAEKFVEALEARGGTAIDDALRAGLGMLPAADAARPAQVLFLTDGLPTIGAQEPDAIVKNAVGAGKGARVFAFGVGQDVNTRLLDRLAEEMRGTRDYVAETENIEEKVSSLYGKLSKPAMTDVTLRIEGIDVSAVHPGRMPDLFHGSEALVAGRYGKGGSAVVRLRGKVRGKDVEVVDEIRLPDAEPRNEFLPRLWAARRVGFLLDETRVRGESAELRDEIVRLAKRFGIVTPYTSYLIVEDAERQRRVAGGERRSRDAFADAPAPSAPASGGGGGVGGGGAPSDEVRRLEEDARLGAESKSADSGAAAVDAAKARKELSDWEGDRDADASRRGRAAADVRHVAGRTFVQRGGVWWDASADVGKARRKVEAFSDAYFALLRDQPSLGPWLALGKVVLVVGDEVLEIG
jgi:Ca-activated chloride channel family protein